MELKSNPEVEAVFLQYPDSARDKMLNLRRLVLEVAEEIELTHLEETLKWGEPSFLAKKEVQFGWTGK